MKKLLYFSLILTILLSISRGVWASDYDIYKSIVNKGSSLYVEMATDKSQNVVNEGDEVTFYFAVNKDCNLILLSFTTRGDCVLLFPNSSHRDFDVSGGSKYEVPGLNTGKLIIEGPPGIDRVKVIAVTTDLFEKFPELSNTSNFSSIKDSGNFLKKLQEELNKLSKDQWVTSDLDLSIESEPNSTTVTNNIYINPDIQAMLDNNNYNKEYFDQGDRYYEKGNYEGAIEYYTKVTKSSSAELGHAYYCMGLASQAKGSVLASKAKKLTPQAEEAFNKAIKYYKECLHQIGYYKESKNKKKFLNRIGEENDCYVRLAEVYDQMGDKKEAFSTYKKALGCTEGCEKIIELKPQDTSPERIYELEMKCEDKQNDKESHMELAVIYEKLERFKDGNYHLKMLLKQAMPFDRNSKEWIPYKLKDDKPKIEKPVVNVPPPPVTYYYQEEVYYSEPYIPPPPPPANIVFMK